MLLKLLVHAGLLLGPMLPRGTGELAFAALERGDFDIYRMDVDRGLMRPITFNNVDDYNPSWSPDSQHIAFVTRQDQKSEINMMTDDGRDVRRLTTDPARIYNGLTISANGQYLAYSTEQFGIGNAELMQLELNTGNIIRLTNNDFNDSSPTWSSNGKQILFLSRRDTNINIYIMDADGGNEHLLKSTSSDVLAFAWSPNGRYLIYTTNTGMFLADLEIGKMAVPILNYFVSYELS